MIRTITQALAVICLAVGPGASAQADCLRWPFKPREPQRTSVWVHVGHADQRPPTLHVAGGVATTLVFDKTEVGSAEFAGETRKRFRTLEVGKLTVVLIPKQDLANGEHISLTVTLKGGTEIPFDLVSPSGESLHGQVDVFLEQESIESVQQALQLARSEAEALGAVNLQFQAESQSVEHALATLLAQGKADHTPFVVNDFKVMNQAGVKLKVLTFRPKDPKLDVGKTAVVFEVTNESIKELWKLDEVRLLSASNGDRKELAVRASASVLGAGQTGRVAAVFDSAQFGNEHHPDHLLLELWRAGNIRQARVELVQADIDARPVLMKVGRARAR